MSKYTNKAKAISAELLELNLKVYQNVWSRLGWSCLDVFFDIFGHFKTFWGILGRFWTF